MTAVLDSNTPSAISRLLGRARDAGTEGGSAIRRLLGRLLLAIIVISGAAIGTQISAAVTLIVGMLAVVETILVSYLAVPAKTQAALRQLRVSSSFREAVF
jgi:hypothetical protein